MSSSESTGRARHSGRENFSIASISRDSHAVWPSAVRHAGSSWFIAVPVGSQNPLQNNSQHHQLVPGHHSQKNRRNVIWFTKDFDALP
jgi:hypothetical protein